MLAMCEIGRRLREKVTWRVNIEPQRSREALTWATHGSHASWKRPGSLFLNVPGPGNSWKITFVLESPAN